MQPMLAVRVAAVSLVVFVAGLSGCSGIDAAQVREQVEQTEVAIDEAERVIEQVEGAIGALEDALAEAEAAGDTELVADIRDRLADARSILAQREAYVEQAREVLAYWVPRLEEIEADNPGAFEEGVRVVGTGLEGVGRFSTVVPPQFAWIPLAIGGLGSVLAGVFGTKERKQAKALETVVASVTARRDGAGNVRLPTADADRDKDAGAIADAIAPSNEAINRRIRKAAKKAREATG